jgi:hypothetical protein
MEEKSNHVTFIFSVDFDRKPETDIPITAYLFTRSGRLLASSPVRNAKVTLKGEAGGRKDLRLFIASTPPTGEGEEEVNLAVMERMRAYEPSWIPGATGHVELRPIPESLWRCWIRMCRVRGRVLVPTHVGGAEQDLPLPHARVHICEVDAMWNILKRIPNAKIFKLRDDLLKILDRTWIPIPNPDPDPGPQFEAGPIVPTHIMRLNTGQTTNVLNRLNPQPEPPAYLHQLDLESAGKLLEKALTQNSRVQLLSTSSLVVRNTLALHFEAVWPVLCIWYWHWPWLWPLLRSWERTVAYSDAQGIFDTNVWYCPFGDHPDLYLWVDYWIDNAWTPVYKPSVRCHTWWNYACGSDVMLHVTDPRVHAAAPETDIPEGSVLVERIGDTWLGAIKTNGTTEALSMPNGLGPMPHAFGDVLSPHVEFSSSLGLAGVTHFRWSYQHVQEDGTPIEPGEPWHVVLTPLSRIYTEIVNVGGHEVWHRGSVALGPQTTGGQVAFKLPARDLPANPARMEGWWDFCRNNEASAFFNTALAYPDVGLAAGWVKLRLELFGLSGGELQRMSPGGGFQIPPSDYRGEGDMTSVPAGSAYVETLLDDLCPATSSGVQVFVLKLRIENRVTFANIIPASVPGSVTGCTGILAYSHGSNPGVNISFNADQPGGFGGFVFAVQLGHLNHQYQAFSKGAVGVAGSNGFGYLAATKTYGKLVPAVTLLAHNHVLDSCICPPTPPSGSGTLCPEGFRHSAHCEVVSGAFSEVLCVYAAVTNGYADGRLWWLDRYDNAGFALVQS